MAQVTQGAALVIDGFDLSCHFKSVEVQGSTDMHDSTVLCTTGARSFLPGLTERSASAEGFYAYDAANDALSVDKKFNDSISSTAHKIVTIGEDGTAVGKTAVLMATKTASLNIQETVGDLIMLTFEAKATKDGTKYGFASGGKWLAYQNVTGTFNGASYDSTSGGTGYLAHAHVTADDMSSMTVKIQHSPNNSTWADLITFNAFSTVGAQQAASTSASVNRYVRAIVSSFSGTSASLAVAIKIGFSG